jgi:hypothetical protein
MLASKIDQKATVVWMAGRKYSGRQEAQQLASLYDKFYLVVLQQNRIDKFLRDFPKAMTVGEAVEAKREAWEKALTNDQRLALTIYDAQATDALKGLDPQKIHDPDLTEAIRLANVKVSKLIQQRSVFGAWSKTKVEWTNPLDKYPLIVDRVGYTARSRLVQVQKSHLYLYINCVYANEKGSSK